MVETKYKIYSHNDNFHLRQCYVEIPKLSPCCGVAHNPNMTYALESSISDQLVYVFTHVCSNCHNTTLTFHKLEERDHTKYLDLIFTYPTPQPVTFNQHIHELSPRFVDLYNQATLCEYQNCIDLAGMGYRAALEILLKDYALHFELDTQENIAKLNLNRAIDSYLREDIGAQTAADVVRILGNDIAHWEQKYLYDLDIIKNYLNIFVQLIITKMMLKHPPVSR